MGILANYLQLHILVGIGSKCLTIDLVRREGFSNRKDGLYLFPETSIS
jgi:hypothetical protein